MLGYSLDVLHHAGNVREDDMILALEDIVWCISFCMNHECIVDKTFAKRLYFCNCAL